VLSLVRKGPNITTTTTIAARQCNPTTFNSTEKREAFKVNQEKEKYQEESPRVSNHQEKVFQRHGKLCRPPLIFNKQLGLPSKE